MTKTKKIKAFSLVELSIVIVIVGILIAGISNGSDIVAKTRLNGARSLTQSSPTASTAGLVAWYETTLEKSFLKSEAKNNSSISTWYDIGTQATTVNNATQTSSANKPLYISKAYNSLPMARFDGGDYFSLPDGTVPYGDRSYTVFVVSKTSSNCNCGFLGSGTYGTTNYANAFRYFQYGSSTTLTSMKNYWWSNDLNSTSGSIKLNSFYIFTFKYDNTVAKTFYINGTQNSYLAGTGRKSSISNNTIGVTNSSEYMIGDIGEIIIFERSLKDEERKLIEQYLSKKWGIKLS